MSKCELRSREAGNTRLELALGARPLIQIGFLETYLTGSHPASPSCKQGWYLLVRAAQPSTRTMLLTSRSPLTHLDRVQSTPSHDLSILASSPIEVVEPHSPPSDGDSSVPLVPASTPTQAKSLYDRYRPVHPSPLRFVTNALERPPPVLQRRLSIANLEAPGSGVICFSRTHQRNLSTPMNVKFKGPGIVVPPVSTNRPILAPSSIASDENAFLICSDYTRLSPAADEFPDSPSIYSPTPPNSSAPLAIDLTESSTGWPNLADADLAAIDVGHHHPFGEQLPGEEPSENQASGEWPCGEDGSTAVSKEISRGKSHCSEWRLS